MAGILAADGAVATADTAAADGTVGVVVVDTVGEDTAVVDGMVVAWPTAVVVAPTIDVANFKAHRISFTGENEGNRVLVGGTACCRL